MSAVIIVAPPEARWAARAEAMLGDARLHVARLHDLGVASLLLYAGGVRALLIDDRCPVASWPALERSARATRVVLISEAGEPSPEVIAWPDDLPAALALIAPTGPAA